MSAIDDVRIAIATFGERIEHVMDRAGSLHALSTAILELDERLKRVEQHLFQPPKPYRKPVYLMTPEELEKESMGQ